VLSTFKNAFKIPDLRRRIFFTLIMLIIFRFGAHIPVPYLNPEAMKAFLGNGGLDLFSLFDVFTGGAFSNATVLALGVSPYINASIIIQLLTVAIPALERMAKEGIEGRKKINKITRYVGIILALVQGAGLYVTLHNLPQILSNTDQAQSVSIILFMLYIPAGFPIRNSAAAMAPSANNARLCASCLSVMVWVSVPTITSCSPIILPIRIA